MTNIPPSPEVNNHHYHHGNYDGQGKTGVQEDHDSRIVMGIVLISMAVFFACIGIAAFLIF